MRSNKNGVPEAEVERYLCSACENEGGFCLKMDAGRYIGVPDRLVVLPGYIALVELKRPSGGRFSVTQKWWTKKLTHWGVPYHIIKTLADVDALVIAHRRC
jgi:hypothetical protein